MAAPGRDDPQRRSTRRIRRFANTGTRQPKFDTRVDYEAPEGAYRLSFAAGFAGTEGMIHTGIGPFDMDAGTVLGYGSARWTKGAQKVHFFTNILNGDANALLSVGLDGQPILFEFNTKTFDVEYGNVNAARHPQRPQLRRQLPLQRLRPVAGAARRQPHRGRRLRPGRDLHHRRTCAGWSARGSTSSACSTTRTSRRGPRSSSRPRPITPCASRSTAPSAPRR